MRYFKMNILLTVILLNFSYISFAQLTQYKISDIPDSLKKHADAVIRFKQEDIVIKSINSANIKIKQAITILKKSGENYSYIVAPYDKLRKIISLKGRYYDKDGKLLKTVKKKDINDISSYSGLFSDNRIKYVEKPALNPPYTVEYEIETAYNSIMNIVDWMPVNHYNLSLEKTVLNVSSPLNYQYRIKEKNFNGKFSVEGNKKTWILENIKPVLYEPYNNSISNLVPAVYLAPNGFSVEGFVGNMETWQNFGKWIMLLNDKRDALPEETVSEIQNLIKDLPDDKAKAKAIYNFMQNKTRYVSIQLGIGGWQPFEASYTDRNGYGDCKALSYYTKSLLEIAGIKSYYTIVNAGDDAEPVIKDFPSLQFNHVILCLPFNNDTTWLECTNQKIPFGYLSYFTDDRDVLVITEEGGKIVHTTAYTESQNTQIRKGRVLLNLDGSINAYVHTEYRGLQYDNVSYMEDLPQKDKAKKIKLRLSIPSLILDSFYYKNDKQIIPFAEEDLKFKVKDYASVSSGRLFLNPNLLNRKKHVPKKIKNRKSDITLKFAYTDVDTIIYNLPENLNSEYLPENTEHKTKFGDYSLTFSLENNQLTYIRKVVMHKGNYPASDYSDLRNFLKFISKSDKQSAVFKLPE